MANPQREDGHVDIANEIVEAFAKFFPSHGEGQIIWAILRKTYGWHKKEDYISISQIMEMTGISRRMVIYCLQNLEAKKMIIVRRKRGRGVKNEINKIGLQKNYDLWVVQEKSKQYRKALKTRKEYYIKSKEKIVQETGGSARNDNLVVQEIKKGGEFLAPTKETITKETIQKTLSHKFFDKNSVTYQLTIYLEGKIRENNKSIQKRKELQLQSWCKDMDKLIRLDKTKPNEIKKIIDWVVQDKFWAKNILCPAGLRKHYPRFYKEVIDRGKSLEEKIETDHRLDDVD